MDGFLQGGIVLLGNCVDKIARVYLDLVLSESLKKVRMMLGCTARGQVMKLERESLCVI